MDIRSELEHENLIVIDRDKLNDDMIKELDHDHRVLMICDIGIAKDLDEKRRYVEALILAEIISGENFDGVMADESLLIIVPFHSLEIAEKLYRNIPHASHFVSMILDGQKYNTAC